MSDIETIGDIIFESVEQVARHFHKSVRTVYRWMKQGLPMQSDGRFALKDIEHWVKIKRGIIPKSRRSRLPDEQDVATFGKAASGAEVQRSTENGKVTVEAQLPDHAVDTVGRPESGRESGPISESRVLQVDDGDDDCDDDDGEGWGKDRWDAENKAWQARFRKLQYQKEKRLLVERKKVEDVFVERVHIVKQGLLALPRSLPPQLVACRTEGEMVTVIHRAVYGLLEKFSRPLPVELVEEVDGSDA